MTNWFTNNPSGTGCDGKKDVLPLLRKPRSPGLAALYYKDHIDVLRPQLDAAFEEYRRTWEPGPKVGAKMMTAGAFASSWKATAMFADLSEEDLIALEEQYAAKGKGRTVPTDVVKSESEIEEDRLAIAGEQQA